MSDTFIGEKIPGLLIYAEADLKRAESYIAWMIREAAAVRLPLRLCTAEELCERGLTAPECRFAINRSRSYDLALRLELWGLRVFNSSYVALVGNHKLSGYRHAQSRGVPFAPLVKSWGDGGPVISKPICGHGGQGVCLLHQSSPDMGYQERLQQAYIESAVGDVRFYLLDNRIIYSVLRQSEGPISNFSLGGRCSLFHPSASQQALVYKLIQGMRVDYAGADFLLMPDGSLLFNELEDAVGSRMLSALGINDTTPRFMRHIRSCLENEQGRSGLI